MAFSTIAEPPAIRARLWLAADETGENDAAPRLWLHLSDGRVLAFRLPNVVLGDDRVIAPLAEAICDDARGMMNGLELPGVGYAHILYAAPVLPVPLPQCGRCIALTRRDCIALTRRDILDFARGLDADVLDFLGTLGGNDFYASVRNYNRIAALTPELRMRRMQALRRFPALVAPILLTTHRYPNLCDGKRHAWRHPALIVESAIHEGRDLTDALAKHYGISRGLVRAPMNAAPWTAGYEQRRTFLALFDALPSNKRPANADEVERHLPELSAYLFLVEGEEAARARQPGDPSAHAHAFRLGWTRTWEICRRRFAPLTHALVDARDFLAAAGTRAAFLLKTRRAPSRRKLVTAWLASYGLAGLLAASARWHRLRRQIEQVPAPFSLPALLGEWREAGWCAQELLSAAALAEEGAAMHHCVGDYWEDCMDGDRIFALRLAKGERATALYEPHSQTEKDVRYFLAQLRGPANTTPSCGIRAVAGQIEAILNADERQAARRAALTARSDRQRDALLTRRPVALLDSVSEQQLQRALAWLASAPQHAEVVLIADVAGYAYHAGPLHENDFAAGQLLQLAQEPDNPYDSLAVRIDWRGQKIGYVPRPHNAEIADALNAGAPLAARILEAAGRFGEPWQRLTFAIETLPVSACTKLAA